MNPVDVNCANQKTGLLTPPFKSRLSHYAHDAPNGRLKAAP
jgi:hypothetical protein